MRPFTWLAPATTGDAVALLREHGPGARVIAGGQTLLLAMKERTASPTHLVSLSGIGDLAGVAPAADGSLEIGAATTYAALTRSALPGWQGVLGEVAGDLADRPIRNRGTVGAALCTADPRYDVPVLAVSVGATLRITGAAGERTLPVSDFLLGVGRTALGPDEILTALVLPPPSTWDAVVFEKYRTRIFDAAIVSVTCAVRRSDATLRVTVGGAVAVPVVLPLPADPSAAEAGDAAAEALLPDPADEAGRFRHELVRTLVRRAVARTSIEPGRA